MKLTEELKKSPMYSGLKNNTYDLPLSEQLRQIKIEKESKFVDLEATKKQNNGNKKPAKTRKKYEYKSKFTTTQILIFEILGNKKMSIESIVKKYIKIKNLGKKSHYYPLKAANEMLEKGLLLACRESVYMSDKIINVGGEWRFK